MPLTSDILREKTRTWLRKGNPKRKTESLLIAAKKKKKKKKKKNAIRTKHIKARIDKTHQNIRCGYCGD